MDFSWSSSINELPCYVHGWKRSVWNIAEGDKFKSMLREVVAMDTCGELDDSESEAIHCLSRAYSILSKVLDKLSLESLCCW